MTILKCPRCKRNFRPVVVDNQVQLMCSPCVREWRDDRTEAVLAIRRVSA